MTLLLGLLLLGAHSPLPAQTGPVELRPRPGNLEGTWLLRTDPAQVGEAEGWQQAAYDDHDWRPIAVPGNWESQGVTEEYPGMPSPVMDPQVSPVNAYNGIAWYRCHVIAPADWAGADLAFSAGGVDDVDTTYVNGEVVGTTGEGLETPSSAPRRYTVPARLVRFGAENVVAVRVQDYGGPGGITPGPVSLLPADFAERMAAQMTRRDAPLTDRFASPPADRRILQIIHNFPKDPAQHEAFLTDWLARGFGGVVCNVHFDNYLQSEELWASFVHAVGLAKRLGMALWLYDEQGYPSGTAGGLTLQGHPEWEAEGLHVASAATTGEAVDLELPAGELYEALACPAAGDTVRLEGTVDLTGQAADGRLRWQPPAGDWKVYAFVRGRLYAGTHAEGNLHRAQPYINLLDPRPTARFLELTHAEYARRIPGLGDVFESTFTDEPSLMSWFIRAQPWPALPWADDFAATFEQAHGYDLRPLLPALVADAGDAGQRVRCDFWDHIAQRTADSFFGQIQTWCHEHHIASGGHLLAEESLPEHCCLYGDFYRCAERLDYPGIDCLTSDPPTVPWHIAKLLGSIAHLHGAPVVMSETSGFVQQYRPQGDTRPVQPLAVADVRGTCNRLYVAGVNTTTSYYGWRDIPIDEQRALNEFVGRCGVMLTGTRPIADIAVLYPIESVWAHFTPAKQGATDSPEVREIDRVWKDVQTRLFAAPRDFEMLSAAAIAAGEVRDGVLHTGPLSFRAVVLPAVDTLPEHAWERLATFWEQGGIVIAVGTVPQRSLTQAPSGAVSALTARLFGADDAAALAAQQELAVHASPGGGTAVFIPTELEPALPAVLDGLLEADVVAGPQPSPVRYAHRQLDGHEAYFVINDSPAAAEAELAFAAGGAAELWDPATGQRSPLAGTDDGTRTHVRLPLEGYGAAFVVFPGARERRPLAAGGVGTWRPEVTPLAQLAGEPLQWTVGGPAHAPCTASAVAAPPGGGATEMTLVEATINQGGVDTWCFASAPLPEAVGLQRGDALRVQTYAPAGQEATSASLLLIVQEADGSDYLADMRRPLSRPGWQQSTVWLDSLSLAGWSTYEDGVLDPGEIRSLRIGWGGHIGTAGEQVRFGIGAISVLRLRAGG